jgi:SAM-dependent methyltransferase
MRTAPDGSPVELYRRLPPRTEEAALVHSLLAAGGSVLDLGCGTGRLAEPLAELGHPVTGVDNEPGMLAELRRSTGAHADITTLDLGTRFDAVLLMSHFVNDADTEQVVSVLRVVRRHTRDTGLAIVERYRPGWVATCTENTRDADGVRFTLTELDRAGDVLTATMRYEFDGQRAEQRFSTRDVDDARLAELATAAGLRLDRSLNATRTLVLLRPAARLRSDQPSPPE